MSKDFYNKIGNILIDKKIIEAENKELYVYGLEQVFATLLNIATTLLIGFLLGMLWQSLLFLIAYVPIRSFAGGYHARTPQLCYFFSAILIIVALVIIKYAPFIPIFWGVGMTVSCGVILWCAPVPDENKPISEIEKRFFKKIVIILAIVELSLGFAGMAMGFEMIAKCFAMTLITLSVMLVMGTINNHLRTNAKHIQCETKYGMK